MFKFSTELFTKNLSEIPKAEKPKRRSKGYIYLVKNVCAQIIQDADGISLDLEAFSMNELNAVIDDFYEKEFDRMEKTIRYAKMFVKCNPVVRKTAFL